MKEKPSCYGSLEEDFDCALCKYRKGCAKETARRMKNTKLPLKQL